MLMSVSAVIGLGILLSINTVFKLSLIYVFICFMCVLAR